MQSKMQSKWPDDNNRLDEEQFYVECNAYMRAKI